jgi:hypothetical protein
MIESYYRDEKVKGSSNRTFGLVMAIFFGMLSLLPLIHGDVILLWMLAPSGSFFLLALISPHLLTKPNHWWTRFGLVLGNLISPIFLGVVFYLTILPIGILLRISGKDLLRLKFNPLATSYWILRQPPGPDPKSMDKQF